MGIRRAPRSITLVLIGSAALAGCGDETARRDIYRTRLDCQADWGDVTQCNQVSSGPHAGYFYGPSYRDDRRNSAWTTSNARQGSRAIGTAHVPRGASASGPGSSTSRGGFGSSASSFSSGG